MKKSYGLIALSSFAFACAGQPTNETSSFARASPGMSEMQGRMQHMQAMMDRIQATEDPQERQRLMSEHMQLMSEQMHSMQEQMLKREAEETAAKPEDPQNHEAHH